MAEIELRCLFSGHVQGVGFRWQTVRCIEGLRLAGFVRNLPDGRVEMRLQGDAELARDGLARVRRAMDRYIDTVEVEEHPIETPLGPFGIRYGAGD